MHSYTVLVYLQQWYRRHAFDWDRVMLLVAGHQSKAIQENTEHMCFRHLH